jgi:hypothetical protein
MDPEDFEAVGHWLANDANSGPTAAPTPRPVSSGRPLNFEDA